MIKSAYVRKIMPPEAAHLLTFNIGNRRHRPRKVAFFCEQIRRKRWYVSTDVMGIRTNGHLANGQHRLMACVITGTPIEVLWTDDLIDDETYRIIDHGTPRSVGDSLQLGYAETADCAFIAQLLDRDVGGHVASDVTAEIDAWWSPAHEALHGAHGGGGNCRGCYNASIRVAAGMRWLQNANRSVQQDRVLEQYRALLAADVDQQNPAIRVLWKQRTQAKRGMPAAVKLTTTLLAWRCFDPHRANVRTLIKDPEVVKAELVAAMQAAERAAEVKALAELDAATAKTPASQTIELTWNDRLRLAAAGNAILA